MDGDAVRGVRGETLDLERRALGPGVHRELGVEPLDGRDRERVDKPEVCALEAGAVDAERRILKLPWDFSAGQTARRRWLLARMSAAVSTMWVARRSEKSPCVADTWRRGTTVCSK